MTWQVVNFKKYEKNTLKGFFDVRIGPLTIKSFTYHVKNGKSWAAWPGKPELKNGVGVCDDDGRVKYLPVIEVEKGRIDDFQAWIRKEIAPFLDTSPQPEQSQDDIPF